MKTVRLVTTDQPGPIKTPHWDVSSPALALAGIVAVVSIIGVTAWLLGAAGALPAATVGVCASIVAGWYGCRWWASSLAHRIASESGPASQFARQTGAMKRLAIYDPSTALYHRWYFELRLVEELHRCQRYGLSAAVILFRLGRAPSDPTFELESADAAPLSEISSHVVRSVDLLATVGEGEYAICLPQTNAEGAEAAATRIGRQLKAYEASVGFAVYPTDASDADSLLEAARKSSYFPREDRVA